MALLGKLIRLKGISQKGKNRIREQGEVWTVWAECDRVLFAPNSAGPFLFIAPIGKGQDDKASRWIKLVDDIDFVVVEND